MDIERAFLSRVISTGDLETAVSKGIRCEHFVERKNQEVFEFLREHVRNYRAAPSVEAVRTEFPDFELLFQEDTLEYLCDQFIGLVKRRYAQEATIELAKASQDPRRSKHIEEEFLEVGRRLAAIVPTGQVARFKNMSERIAEYESQRKDGKPIGVPFGFPNLDAWTGGLQPHEFATACGFSSSGKSSFLMAVAFKAWSQGYTPLYISLEMEARAILRRMDAMAANLDYTSLKHLRLSDDELENWREKAQEIRESVADIPVLDSLRGCTPDKVYAETVRHKPDLVLVDYISLMSSSRPSRSAALWQSLTEITQDMKQNARTLKIPIIAAAQTNREGRHGAELHNVGYSISVTQDPDISIGLFSDEEMDARHEKRISLLKNRDGRLGSLDAIWDHEKMIFRQMDYEETYGFSGSNGNGNGGIRIGDTSSEEVIRNFARLG